MSQDDPNFPYREQIIAAKRSLRARMPDLNERFAAFERAILRRKSQRSKMNARKVYRRSPTSVSTNSNL